MKLKRIMKQLISESKTSIDSSRLTDLEIIEIGNLFKQILGMNLQEIQKFIYATANKYVTNKRTGAHIVAGYGRENNFPYDFSVYLSGNVPHEYFTLKIRIASENKSRIEITQTLNTYQDFKLPDININKNNIKTEIKSLIKKLYTDANNNFDLKPSLPAY